VRPGDPATPADEADVRLTVRVADVRNRTGLSDYTGELLVRSVLRVTDRLNGAGAVERGTVQDTPFTAIVPCTPTPAAEGSRCTLSTTLEAVTPGVVAEGRRSVWELGAIELLDGGADGRAATTGGNTLFAKQGLFLP
jgi:hypothetical protein